MARQQNARMMEAAARLYYEEGLQQDEVADALSVSRSQVSKLLKRAKDDGIVRIEITGRPQSSDAAARRLKQAFSLKEVLIVPSGSPDVDNSNIHARAGARAAEFLKSRLRDGMRIGIEWGTSLYHMIEQLQVSRSFAVEVFQMHGVIESPNCDIEGFVLARRLSRILGGSVRLLQAPMVVATRELRDMLVSEKKIADTLTGAAAVDLAFIGIGSNEQGENELAKAGYLTREESLEIRDRGGTATISGWFLRGDGAVMPECANDRMIGVHPDRFKDIPLVAAVAYGPHKVRSILSALKGGFLHVLITDEQTARGVLAEMEKTRQVSEIPRETLLLMYQRMLRTRKYDQRLEQLFARKQMHGTTHLSIGQEASSVVPGCALEPDDMVFGTHRGHGHSFGKGLEGRPFMAELFGRRTGCSGGKGGSMHLIDLKQGIMGMNGVVAGALPVAVGAALSVQMLKQDRVVAVFLGDGATNEGAFHEAMNLASVWNLPIVFLCENNCYGFSVHISRSMRVDALAGRAASYGMPGWSVDGNDAVEVFHIVRRARAHAAAGGPVFVVMNTYRIAGHSKSDENAYRSEAEIQAWRRQCPLERFRQLLVREGICTAEEAGQMEQSMDREVEEAEAFARSQAVPDSSQVMEHVYS